MPLITAHNLVHRYGDYVAVDRINFQIHESECFGFLGPNGAGKTTTMQMLYCLSPVHGGTLTVKKMDVMQDARAIKALMGVVPQEDNLDPDLTVMEGLLLFGRFYGMSSHVTQRRALNLLQFMKLTEKKDVKPRELSGGMRRRLLIARALIHEPAILILDEPTTGLDPQARLMVWQLLMQLKSSGVTLVLTTHYMEEAAKLCDRLVIMDCSQILEEGAPRDLIRKHVGHDVLELKRDEHEGHTLEREAQTLGAEVEVVRDHYYLFFKKEGTVKQLIQKLATKYFIHRPASLEDVFLKLTGRELRE